MTARVDTLIAELNSLEIGQVDQLVAKLESGASTLQKLGHTELSEKLGEARGCLGRGDVPGFRKAVAHVVSRLGHLR